MEPEYLGRNFKNETRSGRIQQQRFRLQLAQRSFRYQSIKHWNMLPLSVRSVTKISQFKKMVKEWISGNVKRFNE